LARSWQCLAFMRAIYAIVWLPLAVALPLTTGCGSKSNGSLSNDENGDNDGGNSGAVMDDGGISFPPTTNQYVNNYRCPACHEGPDPQSTGTMSGAISPIPGDFPPGVTLYGPNLTPDPTTGIGSWTDDEIQTAILDGIDNQGERLCPEMSHFPGMSQTELTSIVSFLRSLPPVVHQATSSICPPLKDGPPPTTDSGS
jgi:hypothetical protein